MTRALLAPYWYRVAALKPRLRSHVRLHRHEYRGQVWHVFEDRASGRHHRFNAQAWALIALFDGRRSLDEIWALLSREVNDATPTQADIVKLLGQLHAADLLLADVTPDTAELFERRGKHERRKWMGRLANPIALRFPLLDPDSLLERLTRWLRPLGGRSIGLAWLAVVVPALFMLPSHWRELTHNFGEQWLASGHLLMLALLFPLVKIAHELGHGLACKWQGGEVHEAGLMLLAFYPVPYVDVSNASAQPGKWQRALVGGGGGAVRALREGRAGQAQGARHAGSTGMPGAAPARRAGRWVRPGARSARARGCRGNRAAPRRRAAARTRTPTPACAGPVRPAGR